MSAAYDMIDRFLRNNLDDDDYAEFSAALDSLCSAQPAQAVPLLSDAHIDQITRDQWGAHAQCLRAAYRAYARAVEAAVLAKVGIVGKEGA